MQALPIFVLSYSGIVGLGLGIVLFFMSNFIIFSSAKKNYAEGKKIPLSVKLGIKNNALKIVDFSVIAIILAIVLYFIGGVYVQSFALALGITSALNLLTSLALNMLFTKWYTRINPKDAKKLRFTREDNISELD
jgi:preprotein translocase subunit SecD